MIGMGLLNFINVIFTSIYSRQKELAALEKNRVIPYFRKTARANEYGEQGVF